MENMDISPQFKTTSLSVPSPTASHIACLFGARLQIRCLATFEIIRSITLPSSHDLRNSRIAWSPPTSVSLSTSPRRLPPRAHRILVADDETTRVYDLRDEKWNAVVSNGSGGMGKNVHAEFGRTDDEVLVWGDFGSRLVVWCLRSGRMVELRDPKFSGRERKGWGYRPIPRLKGESRAEGARGGVMALLCRSAGQDVLMLLAPQTYSVIRRVELPTVDAQGLKWSRDGRWLAIWDSASSGYRLCIYTADGHLYRTISREPSDEGVEGLGIKTVEWAPSNEWLAVGGWDRRVRILSTRTFAPTVLLDHTGQINVPGAPVYTESVDGRGSRNYSITHQPATPPKAPVERAESGLFKQGISIMAFSEDGTLCATRDDSTPTTVWVWDLRSLKPRTIFIQHAPVKSLQWHPTNPGYLLIQTTQDSPTIYLYTASPFSNSTSSASSSTVPPAILELGENITKPAGTAPARWTLKWLETGADKRPAVLLGHQQGYILAWPDGKDQILRFEGQEGEDSDDSLYDILTGRTPIPPLHRQSNGGDDSQESGLEQGIEVDEYEQSTGSLDDTFREKRRGIPKGRGMSVFEESGLDEMF